jgi:hypothetical protein
MPVKTVCRAARSATPSLRIEERYLSTLRKQGRALLVALKTVFAGRPLHPEVA